MLKNYKEKCRWWSNPLKKKKKKIKSHSISLEKFQVKWTEYFLFAFSVSIFKYNFFLKWKSNKASLNWFKKMYFH